MGAGLGDGDYEVVALAPMLFGRRAVVYCPIDILDTAQWPPCHTGAWIAG